MKKKLSEAIRIGAAMKPQHYDATRYFKRVGGFFGIGGTKCSDVFGAAIDGAGLDPDLVEDDLEGLDYVGFPRHWELGQGTTCPECGIPDDLYGTLRHLNDFHRMTRERIADYVEQIEKEQEP